MIPPTKNQSRTLKSGFRLPPDRRKSHASYARAAASFVPRLTAKVFERYGFHSAEIMTSWETVAGADIAAVSAPERLKWPRGSSVASTGDSSNHDGGTKAAAATLILRVEPAHALEIEYRSGELVDRINRYFGYRAVATVKILQAPLPTTRQPTDPKAAADVIVPPLPPSAENVTDVGLKAALAALWGSVAVERARR